MADTQKVRHNIIVCLSENHSASLLGSLDKFGSTLNPTPNLSKITQYGFSHPQAYCTNASSGNSAFSILTGLPKQSNHQNFDHSKFLAKYFQSKGYQTGYFGSWNWQKKPDHFGFDHWNILHDSEIFFNPKVGDPENYEVIEGHSTDIITDLTIRWLRKLNTSEKPFFVIVSYNSMNRPWMPPVRMINKYNEDWFEPPKNFFTGFEHRTPANKYQNMNIDQDLDLINDLFIDKLIDTNQTIKQNSVLKKNLEVMNDEQHSAWMLSWKPQNEAIARESLNEKSSSIWKFQRFLKNYLRCLLAMDKNIGRLLKFIEKDNKENYHFIYTSERGRFTGEFGWFGSEWMYEPSARIPFIYSSQRNDKISYISFDEIWLDTDLHFFLKKINNTVNKQNRIHDQNSTSPTKRDKFYFYHHQFDENSGVSPHQGFRKGRYKIIHYYPFDEWEFYDLLTDPMENNNIYQDPAYQDRIQSYKILLHKVADSYETLSQKFEFSETWKRNQRSPNKKTR